MMPARKSNPRAEYRLLHVERVNASLSLARKFPGLKSLTLNIEYFDPSGLTRSGGMKVKANLQMAKSLVRFNCPHGDCAGGDYDLSEELSQAITAGRTSVTGEKRCQGVRHNRDRKESVPCRNLLRYKLRLAYV
ncbi:MAG TPA: hypothetical protein VG146_21265 [Verrucomicrobiae bacterium]|nr:hypothetical protein [Verrucomicrobiae bacterium]